MEWYHFHLFKIIIQHIVFGLLFPHGCSEDEGQACCRSPGKFERDYLKCISALLLVLPHIGKFTTDGPTCEHQGVFSPCGMFTGSEDLNSSRFNRRLFFCVACIHLKMK